MADVIVDSDPIPVSFKVTSSGKMVFMEGAVSFRFDG
jgi:hypothetical protein